MDKNTSNNITDPSQGDGNSNPPVQGTNPPSQGDQGNTSIEELQRKLAELERDNRKYRQERKQQEEATALATQKQLEEQGQFKELAEQSQARVKELEPVQERYNSLSTVITEQIKAQTKEWPKEVLDLLPSSEDEPDVSKRLQNVHRLQVLVDKMREQERGSQPGNGPGPKPAGTQTPEQRRQDIVKKQLPNYLKF